MKSPQFDKIRQDLGPQLKAQYEKTANYLNARTLKEKWTILGAVTLSIVALDVLLFLQPLSGALMKSWPELSSLRSERNALREDKRNRETIEKTWKETEARLVEAERQFLATTDIPRLLQSLSGLAAESSVKIVSLSPVSPKAADPAPKGVYVPIPFKLTAQSGTHPLGEFLQRLESGETFFVVTNLRATGSEAGQHDFEVDLQAYKKVK
ncbi:MAG: hypothetical protein MOGMAGMI_01297 [Candidatus Omnitrophica bacterium]|nr:hypothetical protein [Candidatus Omnitrophota bacterium]